MKRILFTFTLILLACIARAQTEKGRWLLGAQVADFSYQKYKNDLGYYLSGRLAPSAGYFVRDNLLIGLELPVSSEGSETNYPLTGVQRQTEWQVGLGPFVRYYMGKKSLKPFAGIGYTYSRYRSTREQDNQGKSTSRGFRGNLAPTIGLAYFVNRYIVLHGGLAYNFYQEKWRNQTTGVNDTYNYKRRSLAVNIGFALLLGD